MHCPTKVITYMNKSIKPPPITIHIPEGIQCILALSYDLEMCAGYSPDGINHGRIMPSLQEYTLRLCDVAEKYNTRLHFFYVCNGLEESGIGFLEEIVNRGHVIDSHTYSHQSLSLISKEKLIQELSKSKQLLKERLGVDTIILRGPYGYTQGWRNLPTINRQVILEHGFKWVSGEYNDDIYVHNWDYWVQAPERDLPYMYPEGLIEIPFQGWTDRMWFDLRPGINQSVLTTWSKEYGHRPIPKDWHAPWIDSDALEQWILLNQETLDFAYKHRLIWSPVWHPYTHYLHDQDCRALEALLQYAYNKPKHLLVCTLRDIIKMIQE